jgi:hypothetical protein
MPRSSLADSWGVTQGTSERARREVRLGFDSDKHQNTISSNIYTATPGLPICMRNKKNRTGDTKLQFQRPNCNIQSDELQNQRLRSMCMYIHIRVHRYSHHPYAADRKGKKAYSNRESNKCIQNGGRTSVKLSLK